MSSRSYSCWARSCYSWLIEVWFDLLDLSKPISLFMRPSPFLCLFSIFTLFKLLMDSARQSTFSIWFTKVDPSLFSRVTYFSWVLSISEMAWQTFSLGCTLVRRIYSALFRQKFDRHWTAVWYKLFYHQFYLRTYTVCWFTSFSGERVPLVCPAGW